MFTRMTTAERLFTRGQRHAAQQRLPEALAAFEQAAALRPRAAGIHIHWALALAEAGALAPAVEVMQQALAWQPTNPVPPLFLSQIYFDAAEYGQAQRWCAQALHLNPHNLYALALQALIVMALGQIPQGYQRLRHPPALPTAGLERWLWRWRSDTLPALVQLSNPALQSRLLLWVETALLQHPFPARSLSRQLLADAAAPAPAAALIALDRLCTRGVMGFTRGYLRLRYAGQPARRAVRLLHTAAEEAYYLGDLPAAQTQYTRLLQQAPEMPAVLQRLCEVCYEQGEFQLALRYLQQYLAESPPGSRLDAWHTFFLGELLVQVGQYDHAAAPLEHAVALGLRHYKLFYYLGLCQLRAGQRQAARWQFARAVQELNPALAVLRLDEFYRVVQPAAAPPAAPPLPHHPCG
jgi:tetratricopeptide (TPR) repeat protein